jgi:hypothetical protein
MILEWMQEMCGKEAKKAEPWEVACKIGSLIRFSLREGNRVNLELIGSSPVDYRL